jgi:hypothetical protein
MNKDEQILKSRDGKAPVLFSKTPAVTGTGESFTVAGESQCSWLQNKREPFTTAKLRERIEPWLTALFQSEHFALLIGSGLSHAVHEIATGRPLAEAFHQRKKFAFDLNERTADDWRTLLGAVFGRSYHDMPDRKWHGVFACATAHRRSNLATPSNWKIALIQKSFSSLCNMSTAAERKSWIICEAVSCNMRPS